MEIGDGSTCVITCRHLSQPYHVTWVSLFIDGAGTVCRLSSDFRSDAICCSDRLGHPRNRQTFSPKTASKYEPKIAASSDISSLIRRWSYSCYVWSKNHRRVSRRLRDEHFCLGCLPFTTPLPSALPVHVKFPFTFPSYRSYKHFVANISRHHCC